MRVERVAIEGAALVTLEPHEDARGWFARSFCKRELAQAGIAFEVAQANVSFNERAGTLRGLHFQREPYGEGKLVRCSRGAIHDVIVDLRPASTTYLRHFAVELTERGNQTLLAPPGVAHGFLTLADQTLVEYLMSAPYSPGHADGVRWDDPAFGIEWPRHEARHISKRDAGFPDFQPV